MKKRLIALFLCSALIFGMVPTVLAEALGNDKLYINYNGETVSTVSYAMSKDDRTVKLDAMLAESASGTYQWQLRVPAGGKWTSQWINLPGQNGASVLLSYGMVGQFMVDGKAQVRVTFTEGNNTLTSDEVSLSFTQEAPKSEEKEAAKPEVIDHGSVTNEVIKAPTETPKTETPKVEETPKTEEPKVDETPAQDEETKTDETPDQGETPSQGDETPAEDETLKDKIEGAIEGIVGAFTGMTTLDDAEKAVGSDTPAAQQDANAGGIDGNSGDDSGSDTTPDVKKTYNIVINYIFENNTIVSDPYTASLAEGSSFSATVTFPTVQGYLPYVGDTQQDSMALNYPSISENVTINVVYKPTNVNYTVIHYQQNVDNDQYTIESTETKQGLTGSEVPEVAKTYEGFYSLLYERPAIAADGSTVIEVYYDRYYYLLNFDMDGGYGTEPVYARYGASIGTVTEPTKAGYSFVGWSETKGGTTAVTLPTTMPAESKTYYAIWTPDATAKVTVVFWGENADDEGYSYLADATKTIYLRPGKEFTYSESQMQVCDKEVHTHTDDCLNCGKEEHTHTAVGGSCYTVTCSHSQHTTSCYSVESKTLYTTSLVETTKPTQTLTDSGNGIYTYTQGRRTYYYLNIGDKWYCGHTKGAISGSEEDDATLEITLNCTHTHTDDCYILSCTKEVHTHDKKCYSCGKEEHNHTSDCYMQGAGLDSKLWKFVKSDTITVAADGSSVLNVYYDRTEFTLTFKQNNSTVKTIKEKWGADIHSEFPIKDGTKTMWWAVPNGCTSMKPGTYFGSLDTMPAENITFTYKHSTSEATLHYYVEALDGTEGAKTAQQIYNGFTNYNYSGIDSNKKFVSYKDINIKKSGYLTYTEEFHDIVGFRQYVSYPKFDKHELGGQTSSISTDNYLLYLRNNFKIVYFDPTTQLKELTAPYGTSLNTSTFNWTPTQEQAPDQYEPGSVEFGGWYLNPECTGEKFDFTTATMPAGPNNEDGEVALSLYAKWVPVTHTVTFYLDQAACEAGTKLDTHPAVTVYHGSLVEPTPENPTKGSYTFIGWFYMENGVEKAFDFANMQVRKDLAVYGKWSSNTLKEYTVQYVLKSDHSVKVADDLTGSGLAGTTKTFDAKGGTELYATYQEGYFPTVQSQSLLLDIESNSLVITFEYVPVEAVPYTVRYVTAEDVEAGTTTYGTVTVDGKTYTKLAEDYTNDKNRKAVVTETFKPISGYMPDAYQKRLVVTAEGENILYFYYTKDETHAYYKITHYTQNTDGATWTEYASSQAVGDIGTRYTGSPMTIPGFTYKEIKYVVNGAEVTDVTAEGAQLTADGLEINLYYVRNEYPYVVRYLEQGSGNVLHDPKNGTGKFGQVISESAIDIDGYDKVDPTSVTLNIRIDEGEGAPNLNIITFYYKEQEVTINYVAVGPEGATNFGSVNPTTETVKVKSGTVQGSTPTAGDGFKFVGWFKDANCTEAVDASWVADNKITPQKTDGKNVAATYYAKFEYDITSLTIQKTTEKLYDENEKFIFTVTNSDGSWKQTVVVPANGTTTINGLKVGETFTITEDSSWAWRYEVSVEEGYAKTVTLKAESNTVAFKNTLKNNKWLTDDAYAENEFKN